MQTNANLKEINIYQKKSENKKINVNIKFLYILCFFKRIKK